MGYSSRKPHQVPLLASKNRNRGSNLHRLKKLGQLENDEPQFLQRHPDGRVRIQCKQHETIQIRPALYQRFRLVVVVYRCGEYLGPSVPIEHYLNATAYLSNVTDHVHPVITTADPSSDGYF